MVTEGRTLEPQQGCELGDSGEMQDFVDGIEQIMSWQDKDLQQYADKSRQLVQDNFSIETVAEKYTNVFKQALE